MRAVPDELADGIALCGPLDRIRERLELWRKSPVTTCCSAACATPEHMKALADMVAMSTASRRCSCARARAAGMSTRDCCRPARSLWREMASCWSTRPSAHPAGRVM